MNQHTPNCFASHLGLWACETRWLRNAVAMVKSGVLKPRAMRDDGPPHHPPFAVAIAAQPVTDAGGYKVLYYLTGDGVAIVELDGALQKGVSKYGGTSTVDARRSLRAAAGDDRVVAVMLHLDSPGGTAAGTMELADEVTSVSATKPVAAHIDDLGASAAYWVASAASRITANAMAEVGSIGVYSVVYDESKAMAMEGIMVHVIGTGGMKGALYPGTEVTPEQLDYISGLVDNVNTFFTSAVQKSRGLTDAKMKSVTDGRVFPAADAMAKGLIDAITPFESAVADLALAGRKAKRAAKASARNALQVQVDLEEANG